MENEVLSALYNLSCDVRGQILKEVESIDSDFGKIEYICKKFLKEYTFDYSVLQPEDEQHHTRKPEEREFCYKGKKYSCQTVGECMSDGTYKTKINPGVHGLKMGTCASFSAELMWFAEALKIKGIHFWAQPICYDALYKKDSGLRPMVHYYVVLELDGEEYKIDVAGAIMAMDYKKKNPKSNIRPQDFIFVDPNAGNPFDKEFKELKGEPGVE